MTTTGPKMFQSLKEDFFIPHHLVFRYLQLRHVLWSQFRNTTVTLDQPKTLVIVLGTEPKKLISNLYSIIRLKRVMTIIQKAKKGWEKDVGDISDSDWDEILEN